MVINIGRRKKVGDIPKMTKGKWTDKVQASDFEKIVNAALPPIGIMLEGEAIVRCPVRTGRLRGSITYAVQRENDNPRPPARAEDKVDRPTNKYTLYVGSNCNYAQHVEYGTRFSRAQPYMRPALDKNKKRCRDIFQKEIKAVLNGK